MILVVALVVFGPRRLPDIGRKIGKGMAEFRRASDDFKRTWEREVELERATAPARLNDASAAVGADGAAAARGEEAAAPLVFESENSVARARRGSSHDGSARDAAGPQSQADAAQPPAGRVAPREDQLGKADWL